MITIEDAVLAIKENRRLYVIDHGLEGDKKGPIPKQGETTFYLSHYFYGEVQIITPLELHVEKERAYVIYSDDGKLFASLKHVYLTLDEAMAVLSEKMKRY